MSDISQVFEMDDIFTIWLAISGIIRVKTPNARLLLFNLQLPNLLFDIPSTHLTKFQSFKISGADTLYTIIARLKLFIFIIG
jgi:hypothetical protein